MKNNKLTLHILEEYAKTLTKSLVKRLYEAKTSKQYNKALFESVVEYQEVPYEFWIDNYIINEYGLPDAFDIKDTIMSYLNEELADGNFPGEIYVTDDGLAIRTTDAELYEQLIEAIEELYPELPSEIINENIDQRFLAEN